MIVTSGEDSEQAAKLAPWSQSTLDHSPLPMSQVSAGDAPVPNSDPGGLKKQPVSLLQANLWLRGGGKEQSALPASPCCVVCLCYHSFMQGICVCVCA